jgi:hypothetical protein
MCIIMKQVWGNIVTLIIVGIAVILLLIYDDNPSKTLHDKVSMVIPKKEEIVIIEQPEEDKPLLYVIKPITSI